MTNLHISLFYDEGILNLSLYSITKYFSNWEKRPLFYSFLLRLKYFSIFRIFFLPASARYSMFQNSPKTDVVVASFESTWPIQKECVQRMVSTPVLFPMVFFPLVFPRPKKGKPVITKSMMPDLGQPIPAAHLAIPINQPPTSGRSVTGLKGIA